MLSGACARFSVNSALACLVHRRPPASARSVPLAGGRPFRQPPAPQQRARVPPTQAADLPSRLGPGLPGSAVFARVPVSLWAVVRRSTSAACAARVAACSPAAAASRHAVRSIICWLARARSAAALARLTSTVLRACCASSRLARSADRSLRTAASSVASSFAHASAASFACSAFAV